MGDAPEDTIAARPGWAEQAIVCVALTPACYAIGGAVLVGLDVVLGPDVYVEDVAVVVILEAFVLAQIAVVGYAIRALVRVLRGGERTLWWEAGFAYALGAAFTYVVWLLWVREFSGG